MTINNIMSYESNKNGIWCRSWMMQQQQRQQLQHHSFDDCSCFFCSLQQKQKKQQKPKKQQRPLFDFFTIILVVCFLFPFQNEVIMIVPILMVNGLVDTSIHDTTTSPKNSRKTTTETVPSFVQLQVASYNSMECIDLVPNCSERLSQLTSSSNATKATIIQTEKQQHQLQQKPNDGELKGIQNDKHSICFRHSYLLSHCKKTCRVCKSLVQIHSVGQSFQKTPHYVHYKHSGRIQDGHIEIVNGMGQQLGQIQSVPYMNFQPKKHYPGNNNNKRIKISHVPHRQTILKKQREPYQYQQKQIQQREIMETEKDLLGGDTMNQNRNVDEIINALNALYATNSDEDVKEETEQNDDLQEKQNSSSSSSSSLFFSFMDYHRILQNSIQYIQNIVQQQPQYESVRDDCYNTDPRCIQLALFGYCNRTLLLLNNNNNNNNNDNTAKGTYQFMIHHCSPVCQTCEYLHPKSKCYNNNNDDDDNNNDQNTKNEVDCAEFALPKYKS